MLLSSMLLSYGVMGQNIFKAKVIDEQTDEALKGATVFIPDLKISAAADTNGLIIISNIPDGKFEIEVSYTGFVKSQKVYKFPTPQRDQPIMVRLGPATGELAEVTIQTIRTNQNL